MSDKRVLPILLVMMIYVSVPRTMADIRDRESVSRKISRYYAECRNNSYKLFESSDKTLVMGAYWRMITEHVGEQSGYREREYNRSKFIGFLNGLSIEPPKWWKQALVEDITDGTDNDELELYYLHLAELIDQMKTSDKIYGRLSLSPELTLSKSADDIPLIKVSGGRTIRDLSPIPSNKHFRARVTLGVKHTYLLIGPNSGELKGALLLAYDLTGKFVWKQTLTDVNGRSWFQGGAAGSNRIELVEKDDHLFVYRSDVLGNGFECLSKTDGQIEYLFMSGFEFE